MFTFYLWAAVPILIAVAVIKLFIRPIFVIASCELYSDFITEQGEPVVFEDLPGKGTSAFVAFAVLAIIIGAVIVFRQQLGLMDVLAVAGLDGG